MEIGSMKLREKIYNKLEKDKNVERIVLIGKPGVGKTWMAKNVSDRAIRNGLFKVALWVFMYRAYDSDALCKSFARQLSLVSAIEEWEAGDDNKEAKDEFKEEGNLDELKKAVKKALKEKTFLLVLDGEGETTKEKLWPLLEEYVRDDEYKVLITRRSSASGDAPEATGGSGDVPEGTKGSGEVARFDVVLEGDPLSILKDKLEAPSKEIINHLAEKFIKKSDTSHTTITMIAKALAYFGQSDYGLQVLDKELEEASEKYNVKQLLFSKHIVLPTSDSKDVCWHSSQFFRHRGCMRYNELIACWILEGYLGRVESLRKTYEQGHHVLMELMDCGVIKKQEAGYVFTEGSDLNLDDFQHSYGQTASLGLATVFSDVTPEWEGFGRITQKDGMIKTLCKGKKVQKELPKENGENQSPEEEGQKLSTLFLDENQYRGEDLIKFLKKEPEIQVLALFNPTITSLLPLVNITKLSILVLRGCDFLVDITLPLKNLTVLEISGASSLKEIPDEFFKEMTQLKSLNISEVQITLLPSSFYNLTSLRWLILKDCPLLQKLESLTKLESLASLDLSGNSSLASVDKNFLKFKSLQSINLSNTMVRTTPLLKNLGGLTHLVLRDCTQLGRLRGITSLTSLRTLDLSGCTLFEEFHDSSLESLASLKTLDLSGTKIDHLLSSISNPRHVILKKCSMLYELSCMERLNDLEVLDLSGSNNLNTIEEAFFDNLTSLRVLNLSETNVKTLPSISNLSNLRELLLSRCESLVKWPELGTLEKLEVLDISHCSALVEIGTPSFQHMSHLQKLNLSETKIEFLPTLPDPSNLSQLLLKKCINMKDLPLKISLLKLEELNLSGMSSLGHSGADFLKNMTSLRILDLSYTLLEQLPSMSNLKNLTHLSLAGCPGLGAVPNLEILTNLEVLDLSGTAVKHLPPLNSFKYLRQLLLRDCSSIEDFPDLEVNGLLERTSKETYHGISYLTSLEYLGLPNIKNIQEVDSSKIEGPLKELKQDQWSICRLSDNTDKPPLFVGSTQFLQLLQKNHSLQPTFHLCVHPIGEQSGTWDNHLQRYELIFGDIYFQTCQFANFLEKRSLQIRGFDHSLKDIEDVFGHVDCLLLIDNKFKSLLSDADASHLNVLKGCWIERCNEMETVFHENEAKDNAKFGKTLETLAVSHASHLESIHNGKQQCGSFNNLNSLYLDGCPKLSNVFRSSWLPENLKVLQVKHCDKLENLFDPQGSSERKFPNLHMLHLWELPELISIGFTLPSLQTLKIWECPKLKNLEEIVNLAKCLETLWISGDTSLKSIYSGNPERNNFINLKALKLENCPMLVHVISSSLPPQNFETLQIRSCENLKTLFGDGNSSGYSLPMLHTLHIHDLPVLKFIGIKLPKLSDLEIVDCPNLLLPWPSVISNDPPTSEGTTGDQNRDST